MPPTARPTPPPLDYTTIAQAPELALLEALDTTLHLAAVMLLIEHPSIADPQRPYFVRANEPPTTRLAATIAIRAHGLRQLLRQYRRAVYHAIRPPQQGALHDEIPF
jgi:hypothetical protein